MFPKFNTQSTNNNMFQGNNTLLPSGNDQSQQNFIRQIFSNINQCQTDKFSHAAMKTLENQCLQFLKSMDDLTKAQEFMVYDQQFNKEIRQRSLKLKKDNQSLMMELFNFKQNLSKIASHYLEKDIDKVNQYGSVQQRIRKVKMDISGKLQKLRRTKNASKSKQLAQKRASPAKVMNLALIELKDASDIVSRQMIKQREEIKTLLKVLYDQNI